MEQTAPRRGGTLAIDLGSTTTVVAHQVAGQAPRLLSLPPYSLSEPVVVPSLLWLSHPDQGRPLIGRQVLEAGLAHGDGPELQRDFKRRSEPAKGRQRPRSCCRSVRNGPVPCCCISCGRPCPPIWLRSGWC